MDVGHANECVNIANKAHFIFVLFAFVFSGLIYSVLSKEIGGRTSPNDHFCIELDALAYVRFCEGGPSAKGEFLVQNGSFLFHFLHSGKRGWASPSCTPIYTTGWS